MYAGISSVLNVGVGRDLNKNLQREECRFVKHLTYNLTICTVHIILNICVFYLSQGVANQTGMFYV